MIHTYSLFLFKPRNRTKKGAKQKLSKEILFSFQLYILTEGNPFFEFS